MAKKQKKHPSYRLHKASGQAIVTLSGRTFYLGRHGTQISLNEYDRVVGEWLANGRTFPVVTDDNAPPKTIAELVNAYRKAKPYPDSQADAYTAVMRQMVRLYGRSAADEFGALALKNVRTSMVKLGWKRRTINQRTHHLRAIIAWGVEHELIEGTKLAALKAVKALREGRTEAPESAPVQPVAVEHVETCLAFMPPTVAAMVRLQMYSGMRAGELCRMTTGDIDTSDGEVWVYRPGQHKTKHHGKQREIALGPKAIEVLTPYLHTDLAAPLFSPARADAERRAARTEQRKTPANEGNKVGTNRKANPAKAPGDRYDTDAYRRAIEYATHRAFPLPAELERVKGESPSAWRKRLGPDDWKKVLTHRKAHHWGPHQLRHAFATLVGNSFSAEHAMKSLGHSSLNVTLIYSKLSLSKAKEVARAIG